MYKAVVIDDEPKVRRGMTNLIPQLDPEWIVVGEAKNGLEGLELVKRERPDLVFTDIRMPKMNGLELLNQLRGFGVQVAILSGYGSFEYAQTAIKFGAFDYLLKPMKADQIVDVLSRVKRQLTEIPINEEAMNRQIRSTARWKEWLLEGEATPPEQLIHEVKWHRDATFHAVLIEVDELDELSTEDQWGDRQLISFAVKNVFQDIMRTNEIATCLFVFQHGAQLLYIVQGAEPVQKLMSQFITDTKKWIKISVSIGLSADHRSFASIPTAFHEAKQALQNKWIYGPGSMNDYTNLQQEDMLAVGYPLELEQAITAAIRLGQTEQALLLLQQFTDELLGKQMTYRMYRRFSVQLAFAVIRLLYEYKVVEYVLKEQHGLNEMLESEDSPQLIHHKLKQLVQASVEVLQWAKSNRKHRAMEMALEYIHNHFREDISLDEIAAIVKLSPAYFSTMFKQEKGITFVEYVTRCKLDKAKELMGDERLRLYEIAEMVGYQDVKYFSRVFKRAVGVTPAEYRQFFYRKEKE